MAETHTHTHSHTHTHTPSASRRLRLGVLVLREALWLRQLPHFSPDMVRDVSCKNCNSKLGWIYEFATEDSQRYKEGRVILERALVRESEGFEEHVPSDNS